jgi:transketolase
MREVFINSLYEEMEKDPYIFFLTADMGINLVEKFQIKYPDRFLNVGIAEQNLIGVASGLAESGMKPFVYTISNFLVHRCLEQIRNDISLHDLHVVLVGTSTGFDNGPLGPTHHMVDDWGILSGLPNLQIYSPYNQQSTLEIFNHVTKEPKPAYVRIPKGIGVKLNKFTKNDIPSNHLVISYGSASNYAQNFAKENAASLLLLSELGKRSFHDLDIHVNNFSRVTVIEDHFAHTGMYSYLCQWSQINGSNLEIKSISPTKYHFVVGKQFEDFLALEK